VARSHRPRLAANNPNKRGMTCLRHPLYLRPMEAPAMNEAIGVHPVRPQNDPRRISTKNGLHEGTSEAGRCAPRFLYLHPNDRITDTNPRTCTEQMRAPIRRPFAAKRRIMRVLGTKMYKDRGERSDPPSLCIFIEDS
jgi:hypothetical protein